MNEQNKGAVPIFRDEPKQPSEDAYTTLLKFLEEIRIVFDMAILATPTGEDRNQFCDLNIKRMQFITEGNAVALHSVRLHTTLDKLKISTEALDEMSCDDTGFDDAKDVHRELVCQLMKIMQE